LDEKRLAALAVIAHSAKRFVIWSFAAYMIWERETA
jgi:hypothetical protein